MKWHLFRLSDGMFTGTSFYSSTSDPESTALPKGMEANIANGCDVITADHVDYASKRVDLRSKRIVEHQPPAPSPDHEWNTVTKRWQLSDAASHAISQRARASEQIAALTQESLGVMRGILLGDTSSLPRLQAIDDQIRALQETIVSIGAKSNGR